MYTNCFGRPIAKQPGENSAISLLMLFWTSFSPVMITVHDTFKRRFIENFMGRFWAGISYRMLNWRDVDVIGKLHCTLFHSIKKHEPTNKSTRLIRTRINVRTLHPSSKVRSQTCFLELVKRPYPDAEGRFNTRHD